MVANLNEFVREHCEGREYDSCVISPCRWSSNEGCCHPQHPKFSNLTENMGKRLCPHRELKRMSHEKTL